MTNPEIKIGLDKSSDSDIVEFSWYCGLKIINSGLPLNMNYSAAYYMLTVENSYGLDIPEKDLYEASCDLYREVKSEQNKHFAELIEISRKKMDKVFYDELVGLTKVPTSWKGDK